MYVSFIIFSNIFVPGEEFIVEHIFLDFIGISHFRKRWTSIFVSNRHDEYRYVARSSITTICSFYVACLVAQSTQGCSMTNGWNQWFEEPLPVVGESHVTQIFVHILVEQVHRDSAQCKYSSLLTRETREGWPLQTNETEGRMGTQKGQMKGVLPWLVRWTVVPVQKIFVLPWLLSCQPRVRICKRLRSPGIDSARLCSLAVRYYKQGCRTGPPGYIGQRIDSWAP